MNSPLEIIALKYIEAGFSVIPLGKDKRPCPTPGGGLFVWKELQERYPYPEEVHLWWGEWKAHGIGIVTGAISGISVVDIDAKSGGLETMKTLRLPLTWTVKTGGGGWHYFYNYSPHAPQGAALYKGIDGRNDGGYVVAAPTLHESGNRYEWTLKEGIDREDFPEELFRKEDVVKKDWAKEMVGGSTEGSRNNNAAAYAGFLFNQFNPKVWEEIVWPELQKWNTKCKPPLSDKELRSVYESIAKKAVINYKPNQEYTEAKKTTVENHFESIEKNLAEQKTFFSWGDEQLDYLLPALERGIYMVLFGQFSSGKTTYAMYLARQNVAKGKNVVFMTLEMSKDILVRNYAFNKAGVTKEIYKLGTYDKNVVRKYGEELAGIGLVGLSEDDDKQQFTTRDIEKTIIEHRPDILIIDNLGKIFSTGKSELEQHASISNDLLAFTRRYGTMIIVIHHTNKATRQTAKESLKGISGIRGTNKINDDADIVCEIGRKPYEEGNPEQNGSLLAVYKDRNFDQRKTLSLVFENGVFYEKNNYLNKAFIKDIGGGIIL